MSKKTEFKERLQYGDYEYENKMLLAMYKEAIEDKNQTLADIIVKSLWQRLETKK